MIILFPDSIISPASKGDASTQNYFCVKVMRDAVLKWRGGILFEDEEYYTRWRGGIYYCDDGAILPSLVRCATLYGGVIRDILLYGNVGFIF